MSEQDFAGKRVLVTGSTRGIGRAAAAEFLAQGAEVILHGRAEGAVADAVAALAPRFGARVRSVAGDLADRAACRRIAAFAGELDVLVNSAGIYEERSVETSDEAFWDLTLAVDLTAPFLLAQALLPGLARRRGVIVNVASDAALLGYAGAVVYCAAKGALVGLTKALAVEAAPAVRALCLCPGPVATDMMEAAVSATPDPEAARRQWAANTVLGRVATPAEIGRALVAAASPAFAFATGSVIAIDGGTSAGRPVPAG